ncbi:MAG: NAD/NADP octopine/nopaline dehydrogenase family protein [Salinivirgaceae bacterium]|nr:NAD/NADP octopine/nopaline dehydrogenase family protein [Salinivirgaceae bacterium]
MKICICGGGALGHVCAGVLISNEDVTLNILTRNPEKWSAIIEVTDSNGKKYNGRINEISDNPETVVKNCDIVFLCLPGYAIENELKCIKPYLSKKTVVGSVVCSTVFFFAAHKIFEAQTKLFGFQRTPFIARVGVYGHSANILGYKSQVYIATENITDSEKFRQLVEKLWITPVGLLNGFYEVSLTNSNPILHTGRLYSLFHNWDGNPFDHNILFYEEWSDDSSETIIKMDEEFFRLLGKLPVEKDSILPLLKYYESSDATSLTKKIKSIPAFQGLLSPMKETDNGFIPDFQNRYFTEDFPFGLRFIKELAEKYEISTPVINEVYEWGMGKINCNNSFG